MVGDLGSEGVEVWALGLRRGSGGVEMWASRFISGSVLWDEIFAVIQGGVRFLKFGFNVFQFSFNVLRETVAWGIEIDLWMVISLGGKTKNKTIKNSI